VTRLNAWMALMSMDIGWGTLVADAVILAVSFCLLSGASILMLGGKELSPHT